MSPPLPFSEPDEEPSAGLVAKDHAGDNAAPLTISEISALLKRTVEDRFGFVRLRGELSGVKRAASGHLYCCLKDDGARIDGVMWRTSALRLGFLPEDGLEVVATGKLTTYPGRSNYQIVIERMEVAGEGALLALLAKLKARLQGEGLFDPARKRPLPFLPRVIGVVTSPTGAVIRDILHRLADRFPSHVVVWPVAVQGQGSGEQVAAAVRGFSALAAGGPVPRPDLVIVARGGGSIEDLWGFNEEAVVRAIAASTIPVISAVGHETDTTLADFAADLRAPTPTAAAELAVPVRSELAGFIAELGLRQRRAIARPVALGRERLDARAQRLPRADALLAGPAQRLDELAERLRRGLADRAADARARLQDSGSRLALPVLRGRLASEQRHLLQEARCLGEALRHVARRGQAGLDRAGAGLRVRPLQARLAEAARRVERTGFTTAMVARRIKTARQRFAGFDRVWPQLDPRKPPRPGFVLVTDSAGHVVTDKAGAEAAAALLLRYPEGDVAVVPGIPPKRRSAGGAPSSGAGARRPGQADLFGAP